MLTKPDHDAEAIRRRDRTLNGRSPAQRTTLCRNKYRAEKYPGKRERREWRKRQDY